MTKSGWKLGGLAAGACLYAFALPVLADDTAPGSAPPAPSNTATTSTKAKEEAVKTVPTWESFQAGGVESVEETFFRLSRDFITTSDDGFKRLGSVPIWPRGDLKIAGFRVLPYLREAVEYQDNYYLQANTGLAGLDRGKKSVWTHVNEAGVTVDRRLMGGRLSLAGAATSVWNVRYNDVQDEWNFNGEVGATYRFPSGFWVSSGLSFERRHDPTDLPLVGDDFGRNSKDFFFKAGFDRDVLFGSKVRVEFGVQASNDVAHNREFKDLNRSENTVYLKASYPFLSDTTRLFAIARHRWDNRQSESINDGKTFGMNVGLEGSIPLRKGEYRGLRGQVSVGFDSALYENDTFRKGSDRIIADENREATTVNAQAVLQYLISPRSSAELRYLHQREFSFYGNYQIVDRVDATFSHNFTRQLIGRVGAYYEHTDPSGHVAQETIPANTYSHGAPNVNRVGAGAGLRYAYNEWMDFDFSADVENRNDHTLKTYRNYTAVLGVTFYLNALTPKARSVISR